MSVKRYIAVLLLVALPGWSVADVLKLREDRPDTYVVKKGDTLWDISEHFLATPWLWPRLWQANPQVANPHLIYPGDRLQLIWVDGEPRLVRKKVVHLSPQIHIAPKDKPIPTLPLTALQAYLPLDRVMQPTMLADAPRVLGSSRGNIRMVSQERLYASAPLAPERSYGIFRPGQIYVDKDSGETLGQRLDFIAAAQVLPRQESEQYSALAVERDYREIQQGDRILPLPQEEGIDAFFAPKLAQSGLNGYILDSDRHARALSKHDVVFISLGARDELQVGDVLRIYRPGQEVAAAGEQWSYLDRAPLLSRLKPDYRLPDAPVGELMVFRTYETMALALITRAEDLIRQDYRISSD